MKINLIISIFILTYTLILPQDILVLNYYSRGDYESDQVISGLENNKTDKQILHIEYLGLRDELDENYINNLSNLLKEKYKGIDFDYVVNINQPHRFLFYNLFPDAKVIYTDDVESGQNSMELSENNLESFVDKILHIQPFIKKLYIQNISWNRLIYLKKRYSYVEFEYIDLDSSVGIALLNLLNPNDGLLLTKEVRDETMLNRISTLRNPVYAFNLTPQVYYSVVFQENFYLKGEELIKFISEDNLDPNADHIKLFDTLYLFNIAHMERYRIFHKNINERVEFFNEKDFFVLVNKNTITNTLMLFLLVFLSTCIFILIKWRTLIKQLRFLKSEAEKHSEVKSQFLANMTHEIRTPLNGIIGMTEIMKGDRLDNPSKMKLKIVESSAKHLLNVVNEILDFSKIEAGKVVVNRDRFNVQQLLREISDIFTSTAQQKKLNLLFYINKDIPIGIIGDYLKIKQILTNLVSNAIKFTSEGEVIVRVDLISLNEGNCKLMFSVKDSGIGIPKEKFNKLFNSFTQLDSSYSRRYGGTGLGLSITKKFLLHMNSDIHFDSQPGDGTLFYFNLVCDVFDSSSYEVENNNEFLIFDNNQEFIKHQIEMLESYEVPYIISYEFDEFEPLFEDLADEDISRFVIDEELFIKYKEYFENKINEDNKRANKIKVLVNQYKNLDYFENLGINYTFKSPLFQSDLIEFKSNEVKFKAKEIVKLNKKVLVVEDNPTNAHVLLHYLDQLGIEGHHAENSKEALEYVNDTKYNLILMDIQLPEMNGFELSNIIKNKGHKLPIIAVTAHSYSGYREKCIENGMNDYLSKPIIFDDLREMLLKYCGDDLINIKLLQDTYGNEILEKLISAYLKSYEQDINDMKQAIKQTDIVKIQKLAHKVKGTLLNFRAHKIAEIFEVIESENLAITTIESLFREGVELINIMNYQLDEVKK